MVLDRKTRGRLAAISSACFIAGFLAYIWSFLGAPVDRVLQGGLLFAVLMVVVVAPIYISDPESRSRLFCWKGFARGMPNWVARGSQLLTLVYLGHLVFCAVRFGWGVPAVLDGQYVIEARGQVLRVISGMEYIALKETLLRTCATMMTACAYIPMMYWWFRRDR